MTASSWWFEKCKHCGHRITEHRGPRDGVIIVRYYCESCECVLMEGEEQHWTTDPVPLCPSHGTAQHVIAAGPDCGGNTDITVGLTWICEACSIYFDWEPPTRSPEP